MSRTISPLTPVLHNGLIAITFFSFVSFISSFSLFVYLTYKFVSWRKSTKCEICDDDQSTPRCHLAAGHGNFPELGKTVGVTEETRHVMTARQPPNQFLVLIFNLLLADLHQATAFLLSVVWLAQDGIKVGSKACFVQGLFDSNGDLSSSFFISTIAVHMYFSVVKDRRPPQRALYAWIIGGWIFVYAMALVPIAITHNGAAVGGYFVRAGPWCWINVAYENLRLLTHYLFIFLSIATTTVTYLAIFLQLRRQKRRGALDRGRLPKASHHPAFLMYPVIYLLCILPLALGRAASMVGAGRHNSTPPPGYFGFAGALIASNGWLDVLLFGATRRALVFAPPCDLARPDTGLETLAFMRTPPDDGRLFGNFVWVQGGGCPRAKSKGSHGWWWLIGGDDAKNAPRRSMSQTSLSARSETAIQMEVVTSVVVEGEETDQDRGNGLSSVSIDSMDKIHSQRI
ncbi:G protein-coupled glucose receptor regulating Gpa2-domain-containing protein [Xylariomycetidae sp. FL0641]|nr:G protein-coupled glucose receptor regulating Gpa2-domain-containing protein [Xylariomycetidae sp. FL0641]